MMKFASQWIVAGACLVVVSIGQARAPAPQPFSLLVVPEQVNMVQVGVDLINHRPVALVTYRISSRTGELVLHGWTGRDWVLVDLEEYRTGEFLVRQPDRIILAEGLDDLPMELVLASGWGPRVMSVAADKPAEFINSMGELFSFTPAEWRWFASRYRLSMEQVGGETARISWYDQMSAARGQPPRRLAEEPPPVPVAPLVVPDVLDPLLDDDDDGAVDVPVEPEPPPAPPVAAPVEEPVRAPVPTSRAQDPVAPLPAADLAWPGEEAGEDDDALQYVK